MSRKEKRIILVSAILILTVVLQGCRPVQWAASSATPISGSKTTITDTQPAQGTASTPVFQNEKPVEIRVGWDFNNKPNKLGWKAVNDLASFSVDQEGLHTHSSGGDPYMIGPSISLEAQTAPHLEIRMRSTKGNDAQVFWEVDGTDFNETASQHFTVSPDSIWHTYRLDLKANKAWQGNITRLRLDPSNQAGADITLAYIRVLGFLPPTLAVRSLGPMQAIQPEMQPFSLRAEVTNTGDQPSEGMSLRLELPDPLTLVEGAQETALATIQAGQTVAPAWKLRGPAGVYPVALWEGTTRLGQTTVIIEQSTGGETVILEGDQLRLSFPRQPYGYGIGTLEWKDGDRWLVAGRLRSLGHIAYLDSHGQAQEAFLYSSEAMQSSGELSFAAVYTDGDGVTWKSRVYFRSDPGQSWIRLAYELEADQPVQILGWRGPEYLVGEGSFGANRTSGLFPGLEFLLGGEQSSGADYVDASASQRFIPHPNKITIPFMAVTQDRLTTGLIWDPLQSWDGNHDRPAAIYASPNRWDNQDNHLMGLLVPGLTAGLVENHDRLEQPYPLAQGQVLHLTAALFAASASDLLSPLDIWLRFSREVFHQEALVLPTGSRLSEESLRLCLDNYTKITWVPSKKGWHYVLNDPWGPGSDPAIGLHLWSQTLAGGLPDRTVKAWRDMVVQSLASPPAGGQPNPWLYQTTLDLHMARSLPELEKVLEIPLSMVDKQQPDGSWSYQSSDGKGPSFGQAGDTSNGYTATFAFPVLYFARLTGDQRLVDSGLKALSFLEKQPIRPEGAQTWELSLHVPDLLASAWVTQSFLEGYRLTGESRYLDLAQRWALAGLPFIYFWNPADRPVMRYTTVPVFGASNYTYPWFGRSVMWNGLDYAVGLQGLAAELEAAGRPALIDWRRLAEGITTAAAQMQPTEGPYLGMYPDAWDVVVGGEAYSWWLTPSYLAQNLFLLQGNADLLVQTRLLSIGGQVVHINAPTRILSTDVQDNRLIVKVKYHAGETMAVMLSPLSSAPRQVAINGAPVSPTAAWSDKTATLAFDQGILLVKIPFPAGDEAIIEVQF